MIEVGEVGMIPVESVVISDRAREVMGDLDSLESNMKETGLISPLAVKVNEDGTFKLLAGERRYTVLKRNGVTQIPVRIFKRDLTELEMKIIEKSENFHRKDMEYWELDKLTLEIHTMQQSIHGAKANGPGQSGWSTTDTGNMLGGMSKGAVSQSIQRAKLREQAPDLFAKCKTASDASAVIKKLDTAIVKQAIAKKIELSKGSSSTLTRLANSYIVKNCMEGIKEIPNGVFHLVEIDPPYAIDLKGTKKASGESQYNLNDYNEVNPEHYIYGSPDNKWPGIIPLLHECYRVMADHSWLLIWFAPEPWFDDIYKSIKSVGFETSRMCPIWPKPNGQTMHGEIYLPNAYEMFFYAWKGRPAIARQRGTNVFNYSPIPAQQKSHPTERPIDMMKDIYETFAFPGSRVLIPFLGSGNGILAAYQAGMTAIGFELSSAYKDSYLVKANAMR